MLLVVAGVAIGFVSLGDLHLQLQQPAAIGMDHLEGKSGQRHGLAFFGQVAKGVHHQTADGIDLLIAELGVEVVVELFDGSQTMDGEHALADTADLLLFIVTGILFLINVLIPDVLPFVDELLLATLTLWLGSRKRGKDAKESTIDATDR